MIAGVVLRLCFLVYEPIRLDCGAIEPLQDSLALNMKPDRCTFPEPYYNRGSKMFGNTLYHSPPKRHDDTAVLKRISIQRKTVILYN